MTDFEYKLKKACYKLFRIIGTIPNYDVVNDWRGFHIKMNGSPTLCHFILNYDRTLDIVLFDIDYIKKVPYENIRTPERLYSLLNCKCHQSSAFEFTDYVNGMVDYHCAKNLVEMRCLGCQIPVLMRKSRYNDIKTYKFIDYVIDPVISTLPLLVLMDMETKEQNTYFASPLKFNSYNTLSI